eukprot:Blabericola_migrator_1__6928@NODE_350_length_9522_cov_308_885246_g281_i0_p4_GENE_NODE_350_length_9522_cov_308_885246_g281_i0NODE_350_length_9522_cov_308_885246_g281_i0_p4_ORF_typecomplete_len347_score47_13UBA/PF00627_31/1_1e06HOIPUBA/PF16678_5/4_2e06Rad60SLD/PF11976_8/0_00084ubiquitin/PF00240_23/0_0028STI1/PF17830_1/78STI1/PF17830_1/0_065UBA_4/PF14555_6/0_11TetR_C_15/PF17918_1/4_3e02TetR_C_15/PF17918_1/45TetR_C_15/PF17918_1/1_2e02TetR_C_15/PF17918_1/41ScsC_N/PF18312_1/41ScsC_N/PF18312_1/4_6e02Sc
MDDKLTLWLQRVPDSSRLQLEVPRSTATTNELVSQLIRRSREGESAEPRDDLEGQFHFIYRGQVIRPDRLLDDYRIVDGDTIFYYVGAPNTPTAREEGRGASATDGFRGIPDDGIPSEVINSPFLDTIANNPELLMMIMEANPAIRQLKERSPELHALFSDPQTLRDAFQAMRNPSVMREMMRHSDRALSNIDAMPGGFDALRQVYKEVHEPVWESLSEATHNQSQSNAPAVTYDVHSPESEDPFPQAWPVSQPQPEAPVRMVNETAVFPLSFFNSTPRYGMTPSFIPPGERYRRQIEDLVAMGFTDRRKCEEALARHGGNLNQAIDDLLQQQSASPTTSHSNQNN